MEVNQLFNISESLREDTSNLFLNQPPQHLGDSCCEEEIEDDDDKQQYFNESFMNKLQKTYKQNKSVNIELLASLNLEGMRTLLETLISESLHTKSHGRRSHNSSDSDSDNFRISNNLSNNSLYKQATFPVFKNLPNDELKIRRNNNVSTYQKVEVLNNSQESYSIIPISAKLPLPEQHDQTVIKLVHEIHESKNTKSVLTQIIRLSPNKFRLVGQVQQILKQVTKHKQNFLGLLQDVGKTRIFSQLMAFSKKPRQKLAFSLKPEEVQLLKSIIEVFDSQNLRNFRGYAYGLMKEYEATEIIKILVKHASWLEIHTFGDMLLHVACLKQVLEYQEMMLKDLKQVNDCRLKELKDLQSYIKLASVVK